MAVYVDPLFKYGGSASFRWERSCHLYADTLEELHAFAVRIGMKREWFQENLTLPHYDLTAKRRMTALRAGAVEHSRREMVLFKRARNEAVRVALKELGIEVGPDVLEVKAVYLDGNPVPPPCVWKLLEAPLRLADAATRQYAQNLLQECIDGSSADAPEGYVGLFG